VREWCVSLHHHSKCERDFSLNTQNLIGTGIMVYKRHVQRTVYCVYRHKYGRVEMIQCIPNIQITPSPNPHYHPVFFFFSKQNDTICPTIYMCAEVPT
jgi:hypothetical protein